MRTYEIRYQSGQSMTFKFFTAVDDADFYYQLDKFEKEIGVTHVPGTIWCRVDERYQVSEPPKEKLPKRFAPHPLGIGISY